MRELAETLKRRAGLRMRQGVVTAVDGSTCSVLIGGSTVPVEGVQHLNSCSPKVDDVVWITSDGADLWIMGTHGAPPPIDPELLPAFSTYFTDADTEGEPDPVTGAAGAAVFGVVVLAWDLPPEALWRTWRVYEGSEDGFSPGEPILESPNNVVRVQRAAGSGPWYYKIRAVNSRGEASTDVQVGPFTVPEVGTSDIAADAVTAAKIKAGEITAAKLNVADVQAAVVTAAAINALSIDAVNIIGGLIQGATVRTADASSMRVQMSTDYAGRISFYTMMDGEASPGDIQVQDLFGKPYLTIRAPKLDGYSYASLALSSPSNGNAGAVVLSAGGYDFGGLPTALILAGGEAHFQADLNVDGIAKANQPCCIIRRTTNKSIADATSTAIDFIDSPVIEKDEGGMWNSGSPAVLTVQEAGVYLLDACVSFAGNATGYRYLDITRNGLAVSRSIVTPKDTTSPRLHVSALVACAIGDVLSMKVRQTSGGTLSVVAEADFSPRLSAMYMRP